MYDREIGYYTNLSGIEEEFYTAPEISPLFGICLAKQLVDFYNALDGKNFTVIEMGGGTGKLAGDILNELSGDHAATMKNLEWKMVEKSPNLREKQRSVLEEYSDTVEWVSREELESLSEINGCIMGNEFLDALPFKRFRGTESGVKEIYVEVEDGEFTEILKTPEGNKDIFYGGLQPGEERTHSPELIKWFDVYQSVLRSGFILFADYGSEDPESIKYKSFRCFSGHKVFHNPLINVCNQDITRSIDFSALERIARKCHFHFHGLRNQRRFLTALGILDKIKTLRKRQNDIPADYSRTLGVKRLILPSGMGESHKAVILSTGEELTNFKPLGFEKPRP